MVEEQKQTDKLSPEKVDKNVYKLARAVEKIYGSAWQVMWRNFLGGMMRSLGAVFGYLIVMGVLLYIARLLGLFDAVRNFLHSWQGQMETLQNLKEGMPLDPAAFNNLNPELLKNLPR